MMQLTETHHLLEMRTKPQGDVWLSWHPAFLGILQPAKTLAIHGKLSEAIDQAELIWIENYGNMHGVEFRCVTKSTTITVNTGGVNEGRFEIG